MTQRKIERSDWYGLYGEKWTGHIVQDAMGHPAKFARGLIRQIYDHAIEEGWLSPGDYVIDPFGGVALGGIDAMVNGMHWIGVELEQRFVDLGCQNIDLWNDKYGSSMPTWGTAVLLQGDSRKLVNVLSNNVDDVSESPRATVSSPPFMDNNVNIGAVGDTPAKRQQIHDSEPRKESYGGTEGQLGNMSSGDIDAAITSPPFTGVSSDGGWQMLGKYAEEGKLTVDQVKGDKSKSYPSWDKDRDTSYGHSDGQLADMDNTPEGLDAAISSPPFLQTSGGANVTAGEGPLSDPALIKRHRAGNRSANAYGDDDENLGNMKITEDGYDAAIGSPPYVNTPVVDYGDNPGGGIAGRNSENVRNDEWVREQGYGKTEGQLSNMKDKGADMAVSSPPYADIAQSGGTKGLKEHGTGLTQGERAFDEYGEEDGQLGRMKSTQDGLDAAVSSPPYSGTRIAETGDIMSTMRRSNDGDSYGRTDGQLGHMKDNDIDAAISSPPYSETRIGQDSREEQIGHNQAYGGTDGQLGGMKDRGADGAISSPPFESVTSDRPSKSIVESGLRMGASSMGDGYGETPGNIGNDSGDDFWLASRAIVDQVYAMLRPGGHAIWVCKRFVKNKKLVYFPRQWAKVCEAAGFRVVHWHRAWVVEPRGAQYDIFGNLIMQQVERKSFFRRLAERKGSPRIDWEDVICMIKPER